jgi:hypothetical protein
LKNNNNNKEYDHLIQFIEKKFLDDKKSEKRYCKLEKSNLTESFSTNLIYVTIDSWHSNNINNFNKRHYLNSTLEYSKVKAIHIDQTIS